MRGSLKNSKFNLVKPIYGIPCRLRTAGMKNAVRQTLKRIRQRSPADFKDLQSLVLEIAPLSQNKRKDGTQGEWKEEQPKGDDPSTWAYGIDRTPGKVILIGALRDARRCYCVHRT
jgi:hypothetical protein